ncbi:uncharacterized protein LOC141613078 [Silene latifolia]|uniref:uncharacterized protein LOC141613078 n=1 Tax=Silene latifolia TaxID=37657 RepID=UPI003D773919
MTKWVWKLLFKPQCLWSRWVQNYVLKGRDIWSATATISQSWYWNNVVRMKDLLLDLTGNAGQALLMLESCSPQLKYSTAMYYNALRTRHDTVTWAPLVHGKGCHPKHSFTGVLLMHNTLPTTDQLVSRGIVMVNRCSLCKFQVEDLHHNFFSCGYSTKVLSIIANWLVINVGFTELQEVIQTFLSLRLSRKQQAGFMAMVYYIWKERNDRIFKGICTTPEMLCFKIRSHVNLRLFSS